MINVNYHNFFRRELRSGDCIHFERECREGEYYTYKIIYERGEVYITFQELTRLYVKTFGKSVYCSSILSNGNVFQLFKISEDEFYNLVKDKFFRVYIDDQVFTLIDYPLDNVCGKLKEILNEDHYDMIRSTDHRFEQSSCIQFQEIDSCQDLKRIKNSL